jgi:hypothetical protein
MLENAKAQENLRFSARCKYDCVYLSIHYSILSKIKSLRLKNIVFKKTLRLCVYQKEYKQYNLKNLNGLKRFKIIQ